MNKILSFFLLLFVFSWPLSAQNLGNEWINYSQSYYSFKVAEDGVYRITYSDLQAAGIPILTINPQHIQIYGRGEQVPLYITNEATGVFSNTDYIEFYAQKNDGWYDSLLYEQKEFQLHDKFSLYTDTARYYLTWTSSGTHQRVQTVTANNYSAYTAEPYFIYRSGHFSSQQYFSGISSTAGYSSSTDPLYVAGEGFRQVPFSMGQSKTVQISTRNAYTGGPHARLYVDVIGASDFAGINIDHHLRISFGGEAFDTLYGGYTLVRLQYQTDVANLNATFTSFKVESVNDIPGNGADRNALSSIDVHYPHTPDLENQNEFVMQIPDGMNGYAYYNFTNFNSSGQPVMYDVDNQKRMLPTVNGSGFQVLIPNAGGEKTCHLVAGNNIRSVSNLQAVGANARFTNLLSLNPSADYFIISHASLMGNSTYSGATDYASYRASTGYNVLLTDVEDLYQQYAYGIEGHPLAIRNFMHDVHQQFTHELKGLLLIGKGVKFSKARANATLNEQNLVPTMGTPGSDVLLTAGLLDSLWQPLLPTGRISAHDVEDVDIYLNKLKEYEAYYNLPPEQWQKNMLHFRGGDTQSLQDDLENYLSGYSRIVTDTFFGADVTTIRKTSSDPIQVNLTNDVIRRIDDGVSLITFFGHAASIGFDISIGNPEEYNNKGKYPVMMALSCYTGDIFQPLEPGYDRNISERYVLIRDKSLIAYMASVTPAYATKLHTYSTEFHKQLGVRNYGETIGYQMQQTVKNIQNNVPLVRETCLEMTLHGDPALKLYSSDQPDYSIDQSSVFFGPEQLTSEVDSFDLNIVIQNTAKAINDPFLVSITRTFPGTNGSSDTSILIQPVHYSDTISVRYFLDPVKDIGTNQFRVVIDSRNDVDELSESNNDYTYSTLIQAADVVPVYPPEFAIYGGSSLMLKASSVYPFSDSRKYFFEIDTTKYFNSPMLEQDVVTSAGGVIEWEPMLTMNPDQVYYWRVSLDSAVNNGFNWRSSSFHYIPGEQGWSQSHFYQFENDSYKLVKYIENDREFRFVNDIKVITARAGTWPQMSFYDIGYDINNQNQNDIVSTCMGWGNDGMQFVVFDTISATAWLDPPGSGFGTYGNVICSPYWPHNMFEFPTQTLFGLEDTTWFRRTADFIAQIPDGSPVLVMSRNNSHAEQYPEYLYQAYDSLGVNLRTVQNNAGIVIFGHKNELGSANVEIEPDPNDIAFLKDSIATQWKEGSIESPVIGPSNKWISLHWSQHALNGIQTDSVFLDLIGIRNDGVEFVIFDDLPVDSAVVLNLNSYMDARDFPYARLVCQMKDDSMRTAAQLDSWQLRYAPVAELAIDPKSHYAFYNDTIMEGDSLQIEIAYRNISEVDMDSVLLSYWVIDQQRQQRNLLYKRVAPVDANQTLIDTTKVPTLGLNGDCYLWMEANPIDTATSKYDQHELTHINNSSQVPFFVEGDRSNPLLDITFDGIRILDGDIVSAEPEIVVALKDENPFIGLQDTSLFKIYLKGPNLTERRVYFEENGAENLEFVEAQLPENKAKVVYRPQFDLDGDYVMRIEAKDASDNTSGYNNYLISFRIINKSTITEVLNWPNPFSTRTHFVFTLTGSELPTYMKIQIMTVTGRVVREIDMDELGPLHIGRNITEYAWDGCDDFGDRLANGVYLYRVVTRMGDQDVELQETQASQYFTKSFGKMYLIR